MKLLKFHATWCAPCKMLSKTLSTIELPFELVDIDIDENIEQAQKYNVRGVPTLVLVDDEGKAVTTHVGAITKEQFQAKFL
jgi:thioredoxin 1